VRETAAVAALAAVKLSAHGVSPGPREQPAVLIDWTSQAASGEGGYHASVALGQPRWLQDFVSHTGQDESSRNPNAKLKMRVPLTANPSPSVSSAVAPKVKLL
jgi:hypothetical protein